MEELVHARPQSVRHEHARLSKLTKTIHCTNYTCFLTFDKTMSGEQLS